MAFLKVGEKRWDSNDDRRDTKANKIFMIKNSPWKAKNEFPTFQPKQIKKRKNSKIPIKTQKLEFLTKFIKNSQTFPFFYCSLNFTWIQ